jgi:hypothetical protein
MKVRCLGLRHGTLFMWVSLATTRRRRDHRGQMTPASQQRATHTTTHDVTLDTQRPWYDAGRHEGRELD